MGLRRADIRLNHPFIQNLIAGMMLFCLPGIYLALTGLGAGGGKPSSQTVAANVNAILYGIFFVTGWFGGTIMNLIGPNYTMLLGSVGYSLYTGGLWYFDRSGNSWFAYLGGGVEGVSAALLWASAGAIAYSYAEEKDKALYMTIQWICCEGGSTIAALVALGINMNNSGGKDAGAPTPVYVVFVVIQVLAMVMSLFLLVRPAKIVRSDGTNIAVFQTPTLKKELIGVLEMIKDYRFMMLLPAIFVAEMALALQSSLNGYFFNLRTRSLNNVAFNFIQIPASIGMTFILDNPRFGLRKTRALIGISVMSAITLGICSAEAAWLTQHHIDRNKAGPSTDWTDSAFAGAFVIYVIYGSVYSIYQIATQYVICSLTNQPERLARYAGVFRGVTALGMMFSFIIDGNGGTYITQLSFQFACYFVGIVFLYIVAIFYVTNTNYFQEENVIVPHRVEQDAKLEGMAADADAERGHPKEDAVATVSLQKATESE
ncbi:major facilitator superfamily domain-containing protein [Talaromyces proteolyticus]|uniref:Major facilitator superfamily domain-containing protein n=1 Tax=Talaromyces proteolyticus TaxID=1131652 RepID=A0AAD4KLN0_9EURO|nr:major facilitator superfamily domain-containing protein [Talaromyces proteolyticus]KAH8694054.1 major facilitator superfamily domain-containing protein [Talaromyces proteolyticus]